MGPGARYCGSCGGAISPTSSSEFAAQSGGRAPNMIGREVGGRYRILTKLGEGGMGAVYRAEQISLKRIVALKVLKPELSSEPGLVRRFNAEATLAAKLNHPNTVTLFDFGQDDDGALFIAMEYIEGKSLRQVLVKEGPLPPDRALAITSQICNSLSDAHATGIVHRDLKPDNVMLFVRGRQTEAVSVLDFGIAKLRDEHGNITQQPMTQAGDILGTPQYMAPEQIRGDRVDSRTDVYALGVMLYEMMTARLPFEGATVMALLSKHLTDIPIAPTARRPELAIPEPISQLIMRCLAKSPDDRPRTMDEIEQFLASIFPARSMAGQSPTPASFRSAAMHADSRALAEAPTGYASGGHGAMNSGYKSAPRHGTAPVGPNSAGSFPQPVGAAPTRSPVSPPAPMQLETVSTRPKSRRGLVLILAVILLGAGGAGTYLLLNQNAANEETAKSEFDIEAEKDSGGDDDNGVEVAGPDETEVYTDPAFNYRMELPSRFKGGTDREGTALFSGQVKGHSVRVLTMAWPVARGSSEADIESDLAGRLALHDVVITNMRWRDARTLSGVVVSPEESLIGEFVLARRGRILFLAAIGSPEESASATEEFRRKFLQEDYEIFF
jgi:serine/threonine protein kinase